MTHTHDDQLTEEFTDELKHLIASYMDKGACAFHQIALTMSAEAAMLLIDRFRRADRTNKEKQEAYAKSIKMLAEPMLNSIHVFNQVVPAYDE